MTLAALSKTICLAWLAYGRAPLPESECDERASLILRASARHRVDPVLVLAHDVHECDLRRVDAPIYERVRGKLVVVGYDRCPMGVRIREMGPRPSDEYLYDLAAKKLARWRRWCLAGHPGGKYRGPRSGHHYVAHYNPGNPDYEHQVLAHAAVLRGREVSPANAPHLTGRTWDIVRRMRRTFARALGGRRS